MISLTVALRRTGRNCKTWGLIEVNGQRLIDRAPGTAARIRRVNGDETVFGVSRVQFRGMAGNGIALVE